jgi:hypothetical protein
VVDGYDENDYFHYNWGWSGRDNAWCPIGAANTTRYNFNTMVGFTGHIVPEGFTYLARPDSVLNVKVDEFQSFDGVRLSWTNPDHDLYGNALTGLTSVTIRRNAEVIAELTDVEVGATMDYEDNGLQPGLYEYAIFVSNESGISRTVYRSILVGEKCNLTFQLHDSAGNGWKGAAISIADENFNRLAIVTMDEGADLTIDLPMLRGNLNFVWNHGWYHAYPEHDTDGECSFSILDSEGNELFTSAELEDGVFMTYENNCEEDAVEETESNNVQVYPNPTNGLLNVSGNGTMCITVSNMLGQKLMEITADDYTTIDLSQYGQGIYMLSIETANGVTVQKVSVGK